MTSVSVSRSGLAVGLAVPSESLAPPSVVGPLLIEHPLSFFGFFSCLEIPEHIFTPCPPTPCQPRLTCMSLITTAPTRHSLTPPRNRTLSRAELVKPCLQPVFDRITQRPHTAFSRHLQVTGRAAIMQYHVLIRWTLWLTASNPEPLEPGFLK